MINFIPLFPLSIVVYPHETLNMHIFEEQYKQLIGDCRQNKKPFGIPVVIEDKIQEYGTLMEIAEITKTYENGELDIKTRGKKVFKVLEHIHRVPDKLYNGAIVSYPHNTERGRKTVMEQIISSVKILHSMLNVTKPFKKDESDLTSYDLAHEIGLTLEQEYTLLSYTNELHRQEYLKRHLAAVLPVVAEMESLKEKIKMNGHFKNISGFNIS